MKKSIKLTLCALALLLSVRARAITHAVIGTNMGNIQLELDGTKAPKTVADFVDYAKRGFYDNTIFHCVIGNFMVQGGGFTERMVQKSTDKTINDETDNGLKNNVSTIAMTRTGDPNSTTSQFFTDTAGNDFLNFKGKTPQSYGYTVFDKITSDMDVIRKIDKVKTATHDFHQGIPTKAVIIRKVSIR